MNKYIVGFENWRKVYSSSSHDEKKKIWIFIKTSDDKEIYIRNIDDWYTFQEYVDNHQININEIGLRHKSNLISIDTSSSDSVYLIRSAKGEFGGVTKNCYTLGTIKGDNVKKTMFLTPELIEEQSYEDNIESCFQEAIVYHGKRKE